MYLIIGASGFIGRHLYETCIKNRIEVCGTCYRSSDNQKLLSFNIIQDDLKEFCKKNLDSDAIKAVIVCSANSSIDDCAMNESMSNQLNVIGTKRILCQADQMGFKCVFLSSEAVFDGKKGMYSEEDTPCPIHLYGRQKLQVEEYMIHNLHNYLILRLSRAVGSDYREKDIFRQFYEKIVNQEDILCLQNQTFCLTEVDDIAWGILKCLEKDICGLHHLSSDNYISRYELAVLYAQKIFGGYKKIVEREYEYFRFSDQRHVRGGLTGKRLARLAELNFLNLEEILDRYFCSIKAGQNGLGKRV